MSKNYCNDDMSDLQQYLDSLDKEKEYFTICQWDDGIVNNIDGLNLKVYSSGGVGDYAYPLNCMPHNTQDSKDRTILASFVGAIYGRHSVREAMASELGGKQDIFISESINFQRFQEVLVNSIFALCPRGYGKTSFRICEALEARVIPVYIYDERWIPFADELSFKEYGVLCHVSELPSLYDKLTRMTTDINNIQNLITRGGEVYKSHYSFEGCYERIVALEMEGSNENS